MFVLGGCGSHHAFWEAEAGPGVPAAPAVPAVVSRGSPLPPPVAQVLEHAPTGARLDYRQPNGAPVAVVLGAPYQSGLQVPCRMGRPGGGYQAEALVFCRQGNEWYAMPPVVVSGL
jgi:hypothetical protein